MSYDSATDPDTDRAQQPTLRIGVEVIRYGARGPVYRVTYAGKVLLEGCRCPARRQPNCGLEILSSEIQGEP
jgi:hypothetical protein